MFWYDPREDPEDSPGRQPMQRWEMRCLAELDLEPGTPEARETRQALRQLRQAGLIRPGGAMGPQREHGLGLILPGQMGRRRRLVA